MEGQDQGRVQVTGEVCQSLGLLLGQRSPAYVIPGAGAGVALREFDFPCLEPPGGVLQVQVYPRRFAFQPLGKGISG